MSYSVCDGHFRLKISSDSNNLSEVVHESQICTLESDRVGAKIHTNLGNVLSICRCMVSASNAHVIENENTLIA